MIPAIPAQRGKEVAQGERRGGEQNSQNHENQRAKGRRTWSELCVQHEEHLDRDHEAADHWQLGEELERDGEPEKLRISLEMSNDIEREHDLSRAKRLGEIGRIDIERREEDPAGSLPHQRHDVNGEHRDQHRELEDHGGRRCRLNRGLERQHQSEQLQRKIDEKVDEQRNLNSFFVSCCRRAARLVRMTGSLTSKDATTPAADSFHMFSSSFRSLGLWPMSFKAEVPMTTPRMNFV